jgi:hypothetical protein
MNPIMKIGDSIKVKQGVISPDYDDLIIEGWQGRIIEMNDDIVTMELDSITLSELRKNYITDSLVEDAEYTLISLVISEVEIVNPRDKPDDVLKKKNELELLYSLDEEDKRILEILNLTDHFVNEGTLRKYYEYLKSNIKASCVLTGVEDFNWEEPYVMGGWSESEYKKKKLTNPSYTDQFKLLEFIEKIEDWKGVKVKVERLSDRKVFNLPLWDLKVVDENSPDFVLISDYSSWMTNYQ